MSGKVQNCLNFPRNSHSYRSQPLPLTPASHQLGQNQDHRGSRPQDRALGAGDLGPARLLTSVMQAQGQTWPLALSPSFAPWDPRVTASPATHGASKENRDSPCGCDEELR